MVTSGLGHLRVSDSTFLSIFTLPSEKWSLHQEKLRDFFVGDSSPVNSLSAKSVLVGEKLKATYSIST
jgi:hypothetical protein